VNSEQDQPIHNTPDCPMCGSSENVIFLDQYAEIVDGVLVVSYSWECIECGEEFG
jgi:hypothetical protein